MAVNVEFSRNSAVAAAGVLFRTATPSREDATPRGRLDESLHLGLALCLFVKLITGLTNLKKDGTIVPFS